MAKVQRTKTEWEELLTKQEESGQGVKEWCNENGIKVNTMYNQISKRHKIDASHIKTCTSTEPIRTSNKKASLEAKKTNSVLIEWKELQSSTEQRREAGRKGSVFIEIGGARLAADEGYPVANLAALCKELIQSC